MLKIFYSKILNYILLPQEHLELIPNLKDLNTKKILKFFLIKQWRNAYNFTQRKIVNPKLRSFFIKIESFFKRKSINYTSEHLKKKIDAFKKDEIIFLESIHKRINFDVIVDKISKIEELYSAYESNIFYDKNSRNSNPKMGYIKPEELFKIDEILKLVNDDEIIKLVEEKLGTKAIFDNVWCWWSFRHEDKALGPQNFHRDYNTLNFVKLFVYLTDVNENSGPHIFVKQSANDNFFTDKKRYTDQQIIERYPKKNILKITGKKYTSFLANTFCLHKGLPPRNNDRLLLCILYSSSPSRACPKVPIYNYNDYKINNLLIKNSYLNQMYFN
jgi:hypothetical protein